MKTLTAQPWVGSLTVWTWSQCWNIRKTNCVLYIKSNKPLGWWWNISLYSHKHYKTAQASTAIYKSEAVCQEDTQTGVSAPRGARGQSIWWRILAYKLLDNKPSLHGSAAPEHMSAFIVCVCAPMSVSPLWIWCVCFVSLNRIKAGEPKVLATTKWGGSRAALLSLVSCHAFLWLILNFIPFNTHLGILKPLRHPWHKVNCKFKRKRKSI